MIFVFAPNIHTPRKRTAQVDAYQGQQLRVRAVTVWAGDGDDALVFGVQLHYVSVFSSLYFSF